MAARVCKLSARSGLPCFLASRGARFVSLIFRDFCFFMISNCNFYLSEQLCTYISNGLSARVIHYSLFRAIDAAMRTHLVR